MCPSELKPLIGEECATVSFVRDYLELAFDGPVLRLLGKVSYEETGSLEEDGDIEFEHSLRGVIGRKLVSVEVGSDSARFEFDRNGIIEVRADGPEFLHFMSDFGAPVLVW